MANLRELNLSSNQLSGSIPGQLCNLNVFQGSRHDLAYNLLVEGPPCIVTIDPDWMQTQTVPPGNMQAMVLTANQVRLTWTPILYAGDSGYYEVSYSTSASGPFTVHGTTGNKSDSSYTLSNLSSGLTYYFRVRTFTPAHGEQQNNLWSDYSTTVSTTPGTPTPTSTHRYLRRPLQPGRQQLPIQRHPLPHRHHCLLKR